MFKHAASQHKRLAKFAAGVQNQTLVLRNSSHLTFCWSGASETAAAPLFPANPSLTLSAVMRRRKSSPPASTPIDAASAVPCEDTSPEYSRAPRIGTCPRKSGDNFPFGQTGECLCLSLTWFCRQKMGVLDSVLSREGRKFQSQSADGLAVGACLWSFALRGTQFEAKNFEKDLNPTLFAINFPVHVSPPPPTPV